MEELKSWLNKTKDDNKLRIPPIGPFLWGVFCALFFSLFGYYEIIQGWGFALLMSFIKEIFLSDEFSLDNILLCVLGLAVSTLFYLLVFF
jgi:hypothetical protein